MATQRLNKVCIALLAASCFFIGPGVALADNEQLEKIPHDTLFYYGTGRPMPFKDMFAAMPQMMSAEGNFFDMLDELEVEDGAKELFGAMRKFFEDPSSVTEPWGFGEELSVSMYTVGVMPTIRIKADAEKFEQSFVKFAAEHELKFAELERNGMKVRLWQPDDSGSSANNGSAMPKNAEPEIAQPSQADLQAELTSATAASEKAVKEVESIEASIEVTNDALAVAKESSDAAGIAAAANEIAQLAESLKSAQKAEKEAAADLASAQGSMPKTETVAKTPKRNKPSAMAESAIAAEDIDGPRIVVAHDGKDVLIGVVPIASDALLDQLLGVEKPATSLKASGKLAKIRSEWGYGDEMAMFMDNKLIADAITGGDSLAASQLKLIAEDEQEFSEFIQMMSAEPCATEIRQAAANVPMLVSGNRKFEVKDNNILVEAHAAVVIEHELLRESLKLFTGAIPVSQSASQAMVSFGVGIDVDKLPQAVGQVTELLSGIGYECELLAPLNELQQADLSSASMGVMMVSGMASGVKGIVVNMYDAEIDPSGPVPVSSVDSAIAIAAEDPQSLITALRSLPPTQALGELPLDGTPMPINDLIPMPLPEGVELFAAVKGKNIVIFGGEQATDFVNRIGANTKELFLSIDVDSGKFVEKFQQIQAAMPDLAEDMDINEMTGILENYPVGVAGYSLNFTDKGIEFEQYADMVLKTPESEENK